MKGSEKDALDRILELMSKNKRVCVELDRMEDHEATWV